MDMQQIPAGYKQTEVGVIPEDWEIRTIEELTSIVGDGMHATPAYSSTGGYYFINGNNIDKGRISVTENTKRVEALEYFKHKKVLSNRTIFLSINGTIGNLAFYNQEPIILGKSAAYFNVKESYSKNYLYYSLQTNAVQKYFEDGLTGTTIKNLGLGTIRTTPIAVPKTKQEQTAIANALSDVDTLITALEKLIDKKTAIKTATMQQLLTGKKRLPPFDQLDAGYQQTELGEIPNDWEVKSIGSALTIRHGRDQKEIEIVDGKFPILATGGEIGRTNVFLYDKPSVLIGRKGTINKPRFIDSPFWTVDTLFYSEVAKNFEPKFIYYKFFLIDWMLYNEASGVPSLNASTIEGVIQSFPSSLAEQTAIANVLSDMDTELDALQQRLAKTQHIKQGMMQELLTGKTRLVTL